jgi:diguanylate cyclase (GGDEF)-like protein
MREFFRFIRRSTVALRLLVFVLATGVAGATVAASVDTKPIDLSKTGQLYAAGDGSHEFPDRAEAIPSLLDTLKKTKKVSLFGGGYWLAADFKHASAVSDWVIDPNNSLIDDIEIRVYAPDGSVQRLQTGYRHGHEYMLHYGKSVRLQPNVDYRVLIKFSSPYFASFPRFEVLAETAYRDEVIHDNVWILGCLGAVVSLALFNLMLFVSTRDKAALYYALYLICFGLGWSFVFHLPAHLYGFHNLSLHYIPFFLMPVTSGLFCLDFLKLRENFPRLAKLCIATIVLALVLLPVNFIAQRYAHTVATVVISIWLPTAILCAIVAWRNGFRPARFFAVAFFALLIPGALILPANLGLMDDVIGNSELFTLIGGTIDALLLAFALADKIKILGQEKDSYLMRLNHALKLAHTDSMTGIGNRHAFDQMFDQELKLSFMEADDHQPMLILVDLDGLKLINDKYGHTRGDDLLRSFARSLQEINLDHIHSFRLGGDEFAIFARKHQEATLRAKLEAIERSLGAQGFADSGVSFGIAFASESTTPADMFNAADRRMYENKMMKRTGHHPAFLQP